MVEIVTESLATKYRPIKMKDVIGQEDFKNMVRTIQKTGVVPKAVLFTGDTGKGKTTLARVLARYINKVTEISQANDIFEYNIGVNGTADDIRDLVSKLRFMPRNPSHKSIYILDEVHRLTKTSASALLKEIEEPPSHVVFLLCTNEPDALLQTIRNRCEKVNLAPYTNEEIMELLKRICQGEKVDLEDKYLEIIIEGCAGQLREAVVTLQAVFNQIKAGGELSKEQLENLIEKTTKYDIFKNVNRFLISWYTGNMQIAVQEIIKCQDCAALLDFALNTNRYFIRYFFQPDKITNEEFSFYATPQVVRNTAEIILQKFEKVKEGLAKKVIPFIAIKIQESLLEAKQKSLIPAFNNQDILMNCISSTYSYITTIRNKGTI